MRDNTTHAGAHALVDVLRAAGVRCIFSLSGNQIMPVYDALIGAGIRLVHVRHEAAAVYMAEAWAQLTGEVGVALVTAGAGFGNALGALISARASETPVLLLSGDSPRAQDGWGAFQEMDQVAMAAPVTKLALRASAPDRLAEELALAIRTARAGRPGPVHLALPADVLTGPAAPATRVDLAPPVMAPTAAEVADLAEFLRGAERPLILVGPALSPTRTGAALARLQAAVAAPVVCMESPRGLRDPSAGALVDLTRQADRIVLLGKPADFTTGFLGRDMGAPGATFACLDPEEETLARARARAGDRLALALRADGPATIAALTAAPGTAPARAGWMEEAADLLARRAGAGPAADRMHPADLGAAVERVLARHPGAVLICDGGEFGQWMQAIRHDGPRVINGVSGAIGAGPAYAIAAAIACPDVPVVVAMGDGTAGFLLAEYETAARESTAFVALVGNDDRWNAEHQIQIREFGSDRTFGCALSPLARYDRVAEALGGQGVLVAEPDAEAVEAAIEAGIAGGRPVCINVAIQSAPAPVVPGAQQSAAPVH